MIFKITNLSIILFVTALLNLFTTTIAWQRRKTKSGTYFALGMTAITCWTVASMFDYAAVSIPLKVWIVKLEYSASPWALMFFAMFAIDYAGYDRWLAKPWLKAIFISIPVSHMLLAWTNDLHGWLWTGFRRNPNFENVVIFEHGSAFTWVTLTGYLFIAITLVCLWQAMLKGSALVRRQARLLVAILIVTILSNLLYLAKFPAIDGVDFTSILFSISGLLMIAALYGTRFLDLAPVARNSIIEKMDDGILVLDTHGQLIDFNPVSQKIFGVKPTDLGQPANHLLAAWPQARDLAAHPDRARTRIEAGDQGDEQIFDVRVTVLTDQRRQKLGELLVFRNITDLHRVEAALRAGEQRYRTVADYTYNWEYWVAPDGSVQYMSPSCERVSGYRAEEFLADPDLLNRIVLPEDRTAWENHRTSADSEAVHRATFRIMRRDGSIRWIAHLCRNITNVEGVNLGIRATHRDITSIRQAEEKLYQTAYQLIEEQQIVAALEERQRLARDLHDSVSQSLHGLTLLTQTLTSVLQRGDSKRAAFIAERVQVSAGQALKDVRLLMHQLQPTTDEADDCRLLEEINFRLENVERRAGLQAELILESDLQPCWPAWNRQILRIVTEALNNSLKHAQAQHVRVLVSSTPQALMIEVKDDGIGFDPACLRPGGMGLQYMNERAALIGGKLEIISAPGQGVRVCLVAPYTPVNPPA